MKYGINEDDEDVNAIFVPMQSQRCPLESKRPPRTSLRNKKMTLAKTALFSIMIFLMVGGNDGWRIIESVKSFTCYALGLECCRPPYYKSVGAIPDLKKRLKGQFFGQHIAVETVTRALDAHLRDSDPGKALVFSFHGWAGSGKTFLADLIAKSLYREGIASTLMRFYLGNRDFPDPELVNFYRAKIREDIARTVKKCEHALFIFDEVDKTPPGVLEVVIPYITHPGKLDGLNFKKAILIFLTNTGATNITNIVLQNWKDGKHRENLTFKDFEESLSREAFNKKDTGLYKAGLIEHFIVDHFIPFLPMERTHIIQCAKAEARRLDGGERVDVEQVANSLTYWPPELNLYSTSGCRKVEGVVKLQLSSTISYDDEDDDGEDDIDVGIRKQEL